MALGIFGRAPLALDIGGSSVVALQTSGSSGRLKLKGCYEWPLSEGLINDGEVGDVDLLARDLRAFASHFRLRGRPVQIAVGNQKVIVRNIDMPDMTEAELRGAIEFQAADHIPIPIDEVVLDFQVLRKRISPDGGARQEVLLVAAQRAMISMFTAALRQAGFKVMGIDVTSLALIRALIPPVPFLADEAESQVARAIADISSSVSTVVIVVGRDLKFTRTINFSSDTFARSLAADMGIPLDEAQDLLRYVGLPGPLDPVPDLYADDVIAHVNRRLGEVVAEIADELSRSLHYYQSQPASVPIQEMILSGKGALLRNLDAYLSESLGMPVVIANPLIHFAANDSKIPDAALALMAPYLSVAVGLALPEEG
ncbi:MAG: type IV pilus assembly protein PilM [Thermoleophilia bacterium]|nr:type IV pilus assembly protein PilM [Thermoleophilia bacterium]